MQLSTNSAASLSFCGFARGLDVEFALPHEHFDGEEHSSDGLVIVCHLLVCLYASDSAQLWQELLVEDRARTGAAVSILAYPAYFFCHWFQSFLLLRYLLSQ